MNFRKLGFSGRALQETVSGFVRELSRQRAREQEGYEEGNLDGNKDEGGSSADGNLSLKQET